MILKSFLSPVTKQHVERKILAATASHLFRIVADVDAYSQFLPLCSHSRVLRRLPSSNPQEKRFEAELTVGLPPLFKETYTSLVVANAADWTIQSTSIKSETMDSLYSLWTLRDMTENRCDVQLEVSMTVRDPIIIAALDNVLQGVASQQVQAFAKRCQQIPVDDDNLPGL